MLGVSLRGTREQAGCFTDQAYTEGLMLHKKTAGSNRGSHEYARHLQPPISEALLIYMVLVELAMFNNRWCLLRFKMEAVGGTKSQFLPTFLVFKTRI